MPTRSGVNVLQLETGVAGPVKVFKDMEVNVNSKTLREDIQ